MILFGISTVCPFPLPPPPAFPAFSFPLGGAFGLFGFLFGAFACFPLLAFGSNAAFFSASISSCVFNGIDGIGYGVDLCK